MNEDSTDTRNTSDYGLPGCGGTVYVWWGIQMFRRNVPPKSSGQNLNTETQCSSETLVYIPENTWCHNQYDQNLTVAAVKETLTFTWYVPDELVNKWNPVGSDCTTQYEPTATTFL
jgi:hypothetical protein